MMTRGNYLLRACGGAAIGSVIGWTLAIQLAPEYAGLCAALGCVLAGASAWFLSAYQDLPAAFARNWEKCGGSARVSRGFKAGIMYFVAFITTIPYVWLVAFLLTGAIVGPKEPDGFVENCLVVAFTIFSVVMVVALLVALIVGVPSVILASAENEKNYKDAKYLFLRVANPVAATIWTLIGLYKFILLTPKVLAGIVDVAMITWELATLVFDEVHSNFARMACVNATLGTAIGFIVYAQVGFVWAPVLCVAATLGLGTLMYTVHERRFVTTE